MKTRQGFNKIAATVGVMILGALSLIFYGVILLLFYGVVMIVFRAAFGVELPNPFFWLKG